MHVYYICIYIERDLMIIIVNIIIMMLLLLVLVLSFNVYIYIYIYTCVYVYNTYSIHARPAQVTGRNAELAALAKARLRTRRERCSRFPHTPIRKLPSESMTNASQRSYGRRAYQQHIKCSRRRVDARKC